MDWADFKASWDAAKSWAEIGTWHWLDESLTKWSSKGHRPWLVIADPGSGPNVQVIPRSTRDYGGSDTIHHDKHKHARELEDYRLCRIDSPGRIWLNERKGIARDLLADKTYYSCTEPDDVVLKAVGCA